MTKYRKFTFALIFISLMFAVLSAFEINSGNIGNYEPLLWGFGLPFGAFVWGDLFVFSMLWTILGIILWRLKKPIYFLLVLSIFWLVRSSGEASYWFLQQFHPDTIPWAEHFNRIWIFANISDKDYWVVNQITHQSIVVLSLLGVIYSTIKLIKEK